jgi:hypothetical protein
VHDTALNFFIKRRFAQNEGRFAIFPLMLILRRKWPKGLKRVGTEACRGQPGHLARGLLPNAPVAHRFNAVVQAGQRAGLVPAVGRPMSSVCFVFGMMTLICLNN